MARRFIRETASPYYPPRARWYSPVFKPLFQFRRLLHLEKLRMPVGFTAGQTVLSLLLPGFALFVNGRKQVGVVFVALYLASLVCLVVWLGFPIGAVGYGLMIAIHASSIVFLESCALRDQCGFNLRLPLAVVTLLLVWLAAYRPVANYVEANWAKPIRLQERIVVVEPTRHCGPVHRGDWLLYSIGQTDAHDFPAEAHVLVRTGFGWGPVLGVAGDTIRFSTNAFYVNDQPHPLLAHMPTGGEMVLPEKRWFVWPDMAISGHGNVGEAAVSSAMLQLASVAESQFVGKPYGRWFWRRQVTP